MNINTKDMPSKTGLLYIFHVISLRFLYFSTNPTPDGDYQLLFFFHWNDYGYCIF